MSGTSTLVSSLLPTWCICSICLLRFPSDTHVSASTCSGRQLLSMNSTSHAFFHVHLCHFTDSLVHAGCTCIWTSVDGRLPCEDVFIKSTLLTFSHGPSHTIETQWFKLPHCKRTPLPNRLWYLNPTGSKYEKFGSTVIGVHPRDGIHDLLPDKSIQLNHELTTQDTTIFQRLS